MAALLDASIPWRDGAAIGRENCLPRPQSSAPLAGSGRQTPLALVAGRVRLKRGLANSEEDSTMDSPFPGMDPYLEQYWRSVHHRLVTYAGDQLQAAAVDAVHLQRRQPGRE